MLTVCLPWPPRELSPNSRLHWAPLAKAKKRYRTACGLLAKTQGAVPMDAQRLAVHLRFVPPDRRSRDADNLVASMKAGLDGLSDALGVDDSRWTLTWAMEEPRAATPAGEVIVEVMAC